MSDGEFEEGQTWEAIASLSFHRIDNIGIYVDPPPVKQIIWKDGFWTPEELVDIMPRTLARGQSREVFPPTLPFDFKM